jgi:ABC-type sugar transport system permease subunit
MITAMTSTSRQRLWSLQSRYAPYLFVAPFLVLFCVFMLYPLGRSIVLSLEQSAGPRRWRFVGLANYRFIVTDLLFWRAVANAVLFTLLFLSVQIPAALGLALLLNSKLVRFRQFFRFAFFSSHVVGAVFVAILFRLLLAPRQGLVNKFIGLIPGLSTETDWLGNPWLAMPAIVIVSLWLSIGWGMVYCLAALQGVDRELYEAAQMDGAGRWSRFWHVTLPGIRPVLAFLVLAGTVGALSLFELPYVFFQGPGPKQAGLTIVMYLYQYGFQSGDLGFASAVGWILVLVIACVSAVQIRLTRALEGA